MKLQITLTGIALYLLIDDKIVHVLMREYNGDFERTPGFLNEKQNGIQSREGKHDSKESHSEGVTNDLNILGVPSTLYPLAAISDENSASHWKYSNKSWTDDFPRCGGRKQSPIKITNDRIVSIIDGSCLKWLNYHSGHPNLTLNNNGHTLVVSSTFEKGGTPILQGGILLGTYKFSSLHFHWGDTRAYGAEHIIESATLPLEMHAVHYNTRFNSIDAAIASDDPEALAVVGTLFKISSVSMPGIMILTRAMRRAQHPGVQDGILPLGNLGYNFKDGYYTYQGSLTIPPCNEIVRWIVSEEALPIKEDQVALFSKLLVNGKKLVNNYRPTQALNARAINLVQSCADVDED